ncbi:hypothetical protein RBB78_01850 [Tunturiibacter empetritectus]|uniref:hypothetical protein n=1 Tax=Tunturiibacter empetritectus TaxID=3069691 RepID=UPI003D9AC39F
MEQISAALESFLAESPRAVVLEDGKVLFDMREAKYKARDRTWPLHAASLGRGS